MERRMIIKKLKQMRQTCDELLAVLESEKEYPAFEENGLKKFLVDIGIKPNFKGFRYIYDAVTISLNEEIKSSTGQLYPKIAERYEVTAISVERCIRHAIKIAWQEREDSFWKNFPGRPTNNQFIFMVNECFTME